MIIRQEKEKRRLRIPRLTCYAVAAVVVVLAIFIASICTIGGFRTAGQGDFAYKDTQAVFYLDYQDETELDKIYVNLGTIYTEPGTLSTLTFKRATTSGEYTDSKWISSSLGKVAFYNIYAPEKPDEGKKDDTELVGGNYNWVKAFDLTKTTSVGTNYNMVQVTFPCEMFVNEIVFVNKNDEIIPAYTKEKDVKQFVKEEYWYSYRDLFRMNDKRGFTHLTDGQDGYKGGDTYYTNFTQSEMYTMQQVDNLLLGRRSIEGTYSLEQTSGPLSVLLPYLGIMLFGKGVFGLRIMPVLFLTGLAVMVYLFGKSVFGSERYGLICLGLFGAAGITLTVGRLGLGFSVAAFFVLSALQLMYGYIRKDADKDKPMRNAMPVFVSGVMYALAVASDPKTVFFAIPLLAMFAYGAVKRHSAQATELAAIAMREQAAEDETPEQSAIQTEHETVREQYRYQNILTYMFLAAGFVLVTVLAFMLLSLPLGYMYINYYDDPANPALGITTLIWKAFSDAFTIQTAGAGVAKLGWFLGWDGSQLYKGAVGEELYSVLSAQMNTGIAIVSGLGFLAATVWLVISCLGKSEKFDRKEIRNLVTSYAVLVTSLAASMLQYAFCGSIGAEYSYLFNIIYLMFIPMGIKSGMQSAEVFGKADGKAYKRAVKGITIGVFAVAAAVFLFLLPVNYGIPVNQFMLGLY